MGSQTSVLRIRAKTQEVVDHHHDDATPGKPIRKAANAKSWHRNRIQCVLLSVRPDLESRRLRVAHLSWDRLSLCIHLR